MRKPGRPDCLVPSRSPSPRSFRSSSAMRKPSSLSRRTESRARAASESGGPSASGGGSGDAGSTAEAGAPGGVGDAGSTADGGAPGGGAGGDGHSGGAEAFHPQPAQNRVAVGTLHGCAIDAEGAIVCWGDPSAFDPLADMGQTTPPEGTYLHISCQGFTCCAVNTFDQVQCWGELRGLGSAGDGTNVSVGGSETCLIRKDRTAACVPVASDSYEQPGSYVQVTVGTRGFACGLSDGGEVSCWGDNDSGQTDPPSGTFKYVAAGFAHACAVKEDGTVACWGADDHGQASPPSGSFRQVSAGEGHTCAVKEDGSLVCWGAGQTNDDCQGAAYDCGQADPPDGVFREVAANGSHSCGLKEDGSIACWGSNTADKSTPPSDFRSW